MKRSECGHSVDAVLDYQDSETCAVCEANALKKEIEMWRKVVGFMKISDLVALAEKAGMTVDVSLVKNVQNKGRGPE